MTSFPGSPRPSSRSLPAKAAGFARALLADPVEAALYLPEHWSRRGDRVTDYAVEDDWAAELHRWLGAAWPCGCEAEADRLWSRVIAELEAGGLAVGRFTYGNYSDGDLNLARAVWCGVRHARPDIVVETGVARGITSRFLLEGLEDRGCGRLWSIDLPHPFAPSVRDTTAAAVPDGLRARWRYIRGSSRRRLPGLLRELGHVDLFVHDSLHTARNVQFEMQQAADRLGRGGLMVVDDVTTQQAFAEFGEAHRDFRTMVCRSADRIGAFGIAMRARSAD